MSTFPEKNMMALAMLRAGMLEEVDGELIRTITPDHQDYTRYYTQALGILELMRESNKIPGLNQNNF